ncbi:MAG: hypothetical protein F6K22_02350 [Okeania sp. SIO2F4]|uniref:hypothetical protein n=1 Tax=Okeania sp. SIO2F4 TaxID=2607790 RepID=UPI00142B1B8C|nr:hypothetical protein [Okeania sp. SIO2F4]NES01764.1 hypothetical protein [Okeania sp. SIO2F4]
MAASIKEIKQNIIKIQGLIKQAQNPVQKKTFSEILKNLQGQLEEALKKQKSTQKTSQKLEIQKIVKSIEPEPKSTTESLLAAKSKSKLLPETTQKLEPKPTPAISTSPLSEPPNTPPIQAESEPLPEPQNTPVIQPKQEQKTLVESTSLLSESESIAKDKSEPKTSNKIFQGLGIIEGKIVKRFEDNDKYYNVVVGDKIYKLIINKKRVLDFVKATYNPDQTQQLLVYPNLVHYPQPKEGTLPPKISFTLVAGIQESRYELKVNEFKLCGIYQQIGVYRGAVISVHRNKTNTLKKIVRKFEQRTKNILRANHIPILWKDSPVKPFRFNPRLDKDQQGDRYFVEIKARFLPDREQWGFMELLGEPTLEFPNFMKAPKPDGTKSKSDNKEKVEKMNQELDTKQ